MPSRLNLQSGGQGRYQYDNSSFNLTLCISGPYHTTPAQGTINKYLESIYGIKTGFLGAVMSNMAKMGMKSVTEEINDKHLRPWSELCKVCIFFMLGILQVTLAQPNLDGLTGARHPQHSLDSLSGPRAAVQ